MKPWAELTPQQRDAARQQYKSLRQLPPEKKGEVRQKWEQYQSLPPETRQELAKQPPPSAQGAGSGRTPAPAAQPPAGVAPRSSPAPMSPSTPVQR